MAENPCGRNGRIQIVASKIDHWGQQLASQAGSVGQAKPE
jgi:hypothetical protein